MSVEILVTVAMSALALAVFAIAVVYRARPHDIDNVILLARKLDVGDLEALFDVATEWNLRRSLTKAALLETQKGRIRLAREYLRRVAHNTAVIQLWLLQEHEQIQWKDQAEYTERDKLVVEGLQLAVNVRIYSIVASVKIWTWMALKVYRWPVHGLSITDLKQQCGVNVLEQYTKLTELALTLSARYGAMYHDQLRGAL
jgi:hypothetical protein